GRLLRVIPDSDHKFIFNFLDSSDKFELTSSYNWDLIFNVGDDSSDTGYWYLNSIEGRKVDISTLEIVKAE
ncbi:MAG: prepilin-type cleavage/methylation domain-containing protein, partial [Mesotoga sp.]